MKTGQQPLLFLNMLLGMMFLGILAEDAFCLLPGRFMLPAAGLLVLAVCVWRKSSKWTGIVFLLLFFVLGAMRFSAAVQPADHEVSGWIGSTVRLSGTLCEAPRSREDAEGRMILRYVVEAEEMSRDGRGPEPVRGRVCVYEQRKKGQEAALRIGDCIQAEGTLKGLHSYGNPGSVDMVRAARAQGITARLTAGKQGIRVQAQEKKLLLRYCEKLREAYRQSMRSVMPEADAAAIFAMLFGGYDGIRPELLEAFTVTGIVHILSVSGSHITLLSGVVAWLGGLLRLRRGITTLFVVLAVLGYSALSGFVPPVLRSAAMGILTFAAMVLEREREARRILAITALLMVLYSPWLLWDVSFQLSFAATAGLLYMGPVLQQRMNWLPRWAAGGLAITLSAQLATLPFLAWYFHQISLSSLLANLTAVPLVELMIVLGLAAGLLVFILPFLGKLVFLLDSLLLGMVYEMTRGMEHLPASQVYLPTLGFWTGGVYYVLLGICLQQPERRTVLWQWCSERKKPLAACLLLVLCMGVLYAALRPQEMAVHFIDVGQGDAALIVTPHGHAFMVDTGGTRDGAFDIGGRVDVPYLWHYGVRSLDYIFLTHAHEDHAAGTGGVLRKIPTGQVLTGHEPLKEYAKSLQISYAASELKSFAAAETGEHIELDGVCIDVLYAPPAPQGAATGNEVSNVIRVSYGRASFLFTGDLVKEQEKKLMAEQKLRPVTVLKVGHHGSKTSTSREFLQALQPKYAMICVGADNSFGHPNRETLEQLALHGAQIFRTDENGAVVFHTDGTHLHIETFR